MRDGGKARGKEMQREAERSRETLDLRKVLLTPVSLGPTGYRSARTKRGERQTLDLKRIFRERRRDGDGQNTQGV